MKRMDKSSLSSSLLVKMQYLPKLEKVLFVKISQETARRHLGTESDRARVGERYKTILLMINVILYIASYKVDYRGLKIVFFK